MSATDTKTYLVYPRYGSGSKPIKVRIDPEFESLIAPLQPDEHALLEANIREHGPQDKLTVWWDGTGPSDDVVLLDGHTRLAILATIQAEELAKGLPRPRILADTRVRDLSIIPDRAAALLWIEENQIGRRNLSDDQRAVIWSSIRERRSAIAKSERSAKANAARNSDPSLSDNVYDKEPSAKRDTLKETAAEARLPERKLRAVAALKKESPELAQEVRAGKTTLREATKQSKAAATPKPKPAPAIAPTESDTFYIIRRKSDSALYVEDDDGSVMPEDAFEKTSISRAKRFSPPDLPDQDMDLYQRGVRTKWEWLKVLLHINSQRLRETLGAWCGRKNQWKKKRPSRTNLKSQHQLRLLRQSPPSKERRQ